MTFNNILSHDNNFNFNPDNALKKLSGKSVQANSSANTSIQSQFLKISQEMIQDSALVDSVLVSEEEIKAYSLLFNSGYQPRIFNSFGKDAFVSLPKKIANILVNFLGGGLLTGGDKSSRLELDGMTSLADNFMLWGRLLSELYKSLIDKNSAESKVVENIIKVLSNLHDYSKKLEDLFDKGFTNEQLYDHALHYSEKVSKLEKGHSEFFSSGYYNQGGGGGHALIVEIFRRPDNDFDIILFTSWSAGTCHRFPRAWTCPCSRTYS